MMAKKDLRRFHSAASGQRFQTLQPRCCSSPRFPPAGVHTCKAHITHLAMAPNTRTKFKYPHSGTDALRTHDCNHHKGFRMITSRAIHLGGSFLKPVSYFRLATVTKMARNKCILAEGRAQGQSGLASVWSVKNSLRGFGQRFLIGWVTPPHGWVCFLEMWVGGFGLG